MLPEFDQPIDTEPGHFVRSVSVVELISYAPDAPELREHFELTGWVLVDTFDEARVAEIASWVEEIATWPEGGGQWLQHHELTDDGPTLARSENFVPFHPGMAALLTTGVLPEIASALLGEPAVLYKEKINYKLPGGAGFSPHQDAPAYPMIESHVSALVAVDDADETNGCLEVVSGWHDAVLPTDERGCVAPELVAQMEWIPAPVRRGQTLWFHSRTPHRSGPNRSGRPRRALYPTYNAASEGDLREQYYAAKLAAFAEESEGDRARVSLIGDFEGRPVT